MIIKNQAEALAIYEGIKTNGIYCEKPITYSSGGNIMITEIPCNYKGMDCFLCYCWIEDLITLFMNRLVKTRWDDEDIPYWPEYIVLDEIKFDDDIDGLKPDLAKLKAEVDKYSIFEDGKREFDYIKYYGG